MLLVILAWYKGASRTGDGVTKQGWKVQRCDGWKPKRSSKTGEQNLTYVLLMPHSASGGFLQVEGHCTVREHSPSMYSFFFHSPSLPWPLWRLAHSEGETFFLAEAGILFVHWKQHCPWKAARRTLQHSPLCLPLSLLLSLHAPLLFIPPLCHPSPLLIIISVCFFCCWAHRTARHKQVQRHSQSSLQNNLLLQHAAGLRAEIYSVTTSKCCQKLQFMSYLIPQST